MIITTGVHHLPRGEKVRLTATLQRPIEVRSVDATIWSGRTKIERGHVQGVFVRVMLLGVVPIAIDNIGPTNIGPFLTGASVRAYEGRYPIGRPGTMFTVDVENLSHESLHGAFALIGEWSDEP